MLLSPGCFFLHCGPSADCHVDTFWAVLLSLAIYLSFSLMTPYSPLWVTLASLEVDF